MVDGGGTGLLGRQVGPYLIADRIGEGGMGCVYAAVDLGLRRRVALKVLHASLAADPPCRDRFVREAQAAARLSHPHIVQVYHAGTDADVTFIALEFIDGPSVGALLRRKGGPLGRRRALSIARDAAAGLGAAHAQGIVHRAVKPDNILVAGEVVNLTDFGIARVRSSPRITDHGVYVGTPRYSSPEQCRSEETDARSDLYSLGVVLYEMLTGGAPHAATTPLALLNKIASEPPRPLRELQPDMPDAIVAVVHRLLEKDPAARYPRASDRARDLEAALAALPADSQAAADLEPSLGTDAPKSARVLALLEGGTAVASGDTLSERGTGAAPPIAIVATPPRPITPTASGAHTPPTSAGAARPDALSAGETLSLAEAPAALSRLALAERLAEAGLPAAAIRIAARVALELGWDRVLAGRVAAQGSRAVLGALSRTLAALESGAPLRPTPGLRAAAAALSGLPGGTAGGAAARIAERVEAAGAGAGTGAGATGGGILQFVACLGVTGAWEIAAAITWTWDEPPTHGLSALALDEEGRAQVEAAATVVLGLSPASARRAVRAFHEARAALAVPPVPGLGPLEGKGAGLPALLAMVAARLDIEPAAKVAAFGALDAATIPPLPAVDRSDPGLHARFLKVGVEGVPGARALARAALEQRPALRRILLPAAAREEVQGDREHGRDLEAAGVSLAFVATAGEGLEAALLPASVAFAPLGLGPERPPGAAAEEAEAAALVRRALALARAILAGIVGLAVFDAVRLVGLR